MSILLSMDVEASGQAPLHGDMISFAAVVIEQGLTRTFYSGNMRPECDRFDPGAYAAIGMSREEHLGAPFTIEERMIAFRDWINPIVEAEKEVRRAKMIERGDDPNQVNVRPIMVSDNPGFDFMWFNFESWNKLGFGIMGHSARRIGDVWAGLRKRPRDTSSWHRYRVTAHDHNPLNDCIGNAEAWLSMWEVHGK